MQSILIDGINKIEKAESSVRFNVAVDTEEFGEIIITGWRLIKGRIWPPAYRAGRGQFFPIIYSSEAFRKKLYTSMQRCSWPAGTDLGQSWEQVTSLLEPTRLTVAKLFPGGTNE